MKLFFSHSEVHPRVAWGIFILFAVYAVLLLVFFNYYFYSGQLMPLKSKYDTSINQYQHGLATMMSSNERLQHSYNELQQDLVVLNSRLAQAESLIVKQKQQIATAKSIPAKLKQKVQTTKKVAKKPVTKKALQMKPKAQAKVAVDSELSKKLLQEQEDKQQIEAAIALASNVCASTNYDPQNSKCMELASLKVRLKKQEKKIAYMQARQSYSARR